MAVNYSVPSGGACLYCRTGGSGGSAMWSNVSSAGAQARNPKFSAYNPSKAALDSSPMLWRPKHCPTTSRSPIPYAVGSHTDDRAVAKPEPAERRSAPNAPRPWWCERWSISLPDRSSVRHDRGGGQLLAPKLARRVLHQSISCIRTLPPHAGRRAGRAGSAQESRRRPKRPARAAVRKLRVPRAVKRAVRLVPGVHW